MGYGAQEFYDSFGNRKLETVTAGSNQTQPSPYLNFTLPNNRIDGASYDYAGNMLSDGLNNYLYDAENRVCAVQQATTGGGLIGYLYAPDGTRLGKGNLTSFSCDVPTNGMLTTNELVWTNLYTVGPQGEQLQETVQIGGGYSITSGQSITVWGAQMVVGSNQGGYVETQNTTTVTGSSQTLAANGMNEAYSYDAFGNIQETGNYSFIQAYTPSNQLSGWSYDQRQPAGRWIGQQLSIRR